MHDVQAEGCAAWTATKPFPETAAAISPFFMTLGGVIAGGFARCQWYILNGIFRP
jgi:hypothetical protein